MARTTIPSSKPASAKPGFPPSLPLCAARGCRHLLTNVWTSTLTRTPMQESPTSLGSVCREPLWLSRNVLALSFRDKLGRRIETKSRPLLAALCLGGDWHELVLSVRGQYSSGQRWQCRCPIGVRSSPIALIRARIGRPRVGWATCLRHAGLTLAAHHGSSAPW